MKKVRSMLMSITMLLVMGAMFWTAGVEAATGEVTRSGSTWTARVDGSVVYTGNRMFDAVNAACGSAGQNSTINIRNSGDSSTSPNGNLYHIRPLANQTLDFHGNTINCNGGGESIVAIYNDRRNNNTIRNLVITGNPRYAIWFRGCSGVNLQNITINYSGSSPVGLGIRVDASTGAASNLTIGTVTVNNTPGHGVETYSINGINITRVNANNTGGCGLLLNDSQNCWVGSVYGYRNNYGGGYATFRCANNNRSTVCDYVESDESGRGIFILSGSYDCHVLDCRITDATDIGIWLENVSNSSVQSGCCNSGVAVSGSGSYANVSSSCSGGGGGGITGTKILLNVASGRAMGTPGNSNGSNVDIWDYFGATAQIWNIAQSGDAYTIRSAQSGGRAADVWNWGTGNGTNIALYDFWGGDSQRYYIDDVGGGEYRITPVISTGQCLDAYGTANGSNVGTWSYWGGDNQKWTIQNP